MFRTFPETTAGMQFIRFLFVGGINTLFGYACFAFFIFIRLHWSLAMLSTTVAGILFNFLTTGTLVFQRIRLMYLPKFFLGYAIIYLINLFLMWMLKHFICSDYLAGFVIVAPAAAVSFFINKYLVFRDTL